MCLQRPIAAEQPADPSPPSTQGKEPSWIAWWELQSMRAWLAKKDTSLGEQGTEQPPDLTFGHSPSAAHRKISFALFTSCSLGIPCILLAGDHRLCPLAPRFTGK